MLFLSEPKDNPFSCFLCTPEPTWDISRPLHKVLRENPTIPVFSDTVHLPDLHSLMFVILPGELPKMMLYRDANRLYLKPDYEYPPTWRNPWNGFSLEFKEDYSDDIALQFVLDCRAYTKDMQLCYYSRHLIPIPKNSVRLKCVSCNKEERDATKFLKKK